MRPADVARLVVLAALWGASYLFMRHAVPYLGTLWLIELRVLVGGLALLGFLLATRQAIGWKSHWRGYLFVGAIGVALPFVLIAEALKSIDASTAAILNALSPLFGALVAAVWIREPLTREKLGGIALCIAGTAILVGWTPTPMTSRELLAAAFSVIATALYAFSSVFTKVKLGDARPMGTAGGTLLVAAAVLAPLTLAVPAPQAVPAPVWGSVLGLALLCTSAAFILYYRLIADVGPVNAVTVTLLVPVFGMLWGVLFLDETLTAGRIAGCITVLSGCALILGLVRWPASMKTPG